MADERSEMVEDDSLAGYADWVKPERGMITVPFYQELCGS